MSPDGERITLVDDNGRILGDNESLLALLALVLGPCSGNAEVTGGRGGPAPAQSVEGAGPVSIALPVTAATAAENMCQRAGAQLIWTKLSTSHLMEMASTPGVEFAAGAEGGYIFPKFLPAYDALAALAHIFALLAHTGQRLSQVVAAAPPVFSAHEGVVTPWEKKGLVMGAVMELGRDRPMVLVDGVKIVHEDGWCLVVPDPEEALTHIWAEGPSGEEAQARARQYARRVRNLLRSGTLPGG